jgi:hypothetical protein
MDTRSGGDGKGNDPSVSPICSTDRIAYTWGNINVHASVQKLRRRGIWCLPCLRSTTEHEGKHILKNGDLSLFTLTAYLFPSKVTHIAYLYIISLSF